MTSKIKESLLEKKEKTEQKKKISILKERKNFLKRNIQNYKDLPITLNILGKVPQKIYFQMEGKKSLILKAKRNLKVEIKDLNNLHLKSTTKRKENFKIF